MALPGHPFRYSATIRATGSCWAIPDPSRTLGPPLFRVGSAQNADTGKSQSPTSASPRLTPRGSDRLQPLRTLFMPRAAQAVLWLL